MPPLAPELTLSELKNFRGKALRHVIHLLVHATLHLLGHDHQTDAEAARMEALEVKILAGLGFPDPYASGRE